MTRQRPTVTYESSDPSLLPSQLIQSALLLCDLEERGLVDDIAERIRIRRQGGFAGVDICLLLLTFLASSPHGGIRPFWKHLQPVVKGVAGLARRSTLPSPSATSRGLSRVETDLIRPQTAWLLTEAPQMDEVLKHPSVLHFDAKGSGWHVFDLDPTVTTLRQRALPIGDDLPEPIRRAEETGKPGHSGRKRGDIQCRRVDVQHAGAGVFVHAHLHPGNGHGTADLDLAMGSVTTLRDRMGWPKERVLIRADGEFGTVPYFHVFRKHGLPFITRANYPSLYDDPNVLDQLRTATWEQVPDSGSGPRRMATDLGIVELRANQKTRRPDGSRYDPIRVRIVASAYEATDKQQRGRKMDGWQIELFAADIPADSWPAAEVVAAYFGRSCQENRFAQEDREVGLDRIFSYELAGQELATLTGLFLLNYRIARGFELDPPPAVRPAPVLRIPVVDERLPAGWPRDPVLGRTLGKLDWEGILARRPGWTWDTVRGELRCAEGRALELSSVRPSPNSSRCTSVIFRRPSPGCQDCGNRTGCLTSADADAHKQLELSIDTKLAKKLRQRLGRIRTKSPEKRGTVPEAIGETAGIHAILSPRFLPREARKVFEELFISASVRVTVSKPNAPKPKLRLVADGDADRQCRRQTWNERVSRYALAEDATVRLEIATGRGIGRWLKLGQDVENTEEAAS